MELILDSHGLDESHSGGRVEPVHRVARDLAVSAFDREVERRVVQRGLVETLLDTVPVSLSQGMGRVPTLRAIDENEVLREGRHLRTVGRSHPGGAVVVARRESIASAQVLGRFDRRR